MKEVTDEHVHDSSKELPAELVDNIIKSDSILFRQNRDSKIMDFNNHATKHEARVVNHNLCLFLLPE